MIKPVLRCFGSGYGLTVPTPLYATYLTLFDASATTNAIYPFDSCGVSATSLPLAE
jgi:hypothetical protein